MSLRYALLFPVRVAVRPIWRRTWARLEQRLQPSDARLAALEPKMAHALRVIEEQGLQSGELADLSIHAGQKAETAAGQAEAALIRLSSLEGRLSSFGDSWRQYVPAFLNAVTSVRAFGFELSSQRNALSAVVASQDTNLSNMRGEQAKAQEELKRSLEALRTEVLEAVVEARGAVQPMLDALRTETDAAITETRREATSAFEALRTELRAIAAETEDSAVHAVQDRLEFVRREILFETLHGSGSAVPTTTIEPRIVTKDKIAAAGEMVRLNLGCGHIPLEGYINVDQRDLPGVDIIAEAGAVPVRSGTVREVFSAHLLEHFPEEALRRRLLPYWRGLMAPGGTFRAVVPDGEAMLVGAGDGTYSFEEFREVLFGAQDYAGDFHYNLYTPDSLAALLREAEFKDIDIPVRGRRNGKCFEFEITAIRD